MSDLSVVDRPAVPAVEPPTVSILFARHGATAMNLAGQRCGGDIDPPLAAAGLEQAMQLARDVAAMSAPPRLVVTSDLLRARHTAEIVCQALGGVPLVVLPSLRERSLGFWNLEPIEDTEAALSRGDTPPCGEAADDFRLRVEGAWGELRPWLDQRVLVVASKGVARVLLALTGTPARAPLGNAELVELALPARLAGPAPRG